MITDLYFVSRRQYIKVLRCGIHSTFDLKKLFYDKIIIGTDADIDGYGIAIGIAGTHVLITDLYFVSLNHFFHIDFNQFAFISDERFILIGALVNGRDPNTQAVFAFRGQTLNPFKTTFSKFMENKTPTRQTGSLQYRTGMSIIHLL